MPQTFNIFPDLFTFSLIAPVVLRVVAGLIFINIGSLKLGKERPSWISSLNLIHLHPASFFVSLLGIIEVVGGFLLVIGAYTQLAALVLAVFCICEMLIEFKEESILKRDLAFYLLLSAICLSLLLTGAGLFAFDIPLL